jgi:hypothetical protein
MTFLGGWLATWGFTADERDAALTPRPNADPAQHEPDAS